MIRKNDESTLHEFRCVGGGDGELEFHHKFTKEEMFGLCRLCSEITLQPGQSIGMHKHENEVEIFYMLHGELVSINPDGSEEPFKPGDAMSTGGGDSHALRNDGTQPATMLAVIAIR